MNQGSANKLLETRLLLVEDFPDDQRLMALLLTRAGAEVILECNGEGALEQFLLSQTNGKVFDGILMDLQMPGMNGIEATKRLRSRGFEGPIVAITAHGDRDTESEWRAAGCTSYLAKPFKAQEFVEIVTQALEYSPVAS
ncbi:MAG: response regulator [Planctomycetes bacterium]|nr:response regulator [Planctomycetota bacterium]